MNQAEAGQDVRARLRQWRLRLVLQRLVFTAGAVSVWVATARWLLTPGTTLLLQLGALTLVSFAQLVYSQKWRQLTADNFLQHLNRRFPAFEESAQLLMQDDDALTVMQRLQRQRAQAVYADNLAQVKQWQPVIRYRLAVGAMLLGGLLSLATDQLLSLSEHWLPEAGPVLSGSEENTDTTRLTEISVRIQPPDYTGLPATATDQTDLDLIEGSLVTWDLAFSKHADSYALVLSDGPRIALSSDEQNHWHAETTVSKTDLYRIMVQTAGQETSTGDIYSLTVHLDQSPDIRVVKPEVETLEIPKNGPARFSSEVLVTDDYGVQSVEILASVAKGSGEGVKFRDQQLAFDHSEETTNGVLYQREWDLPALGMEPGDEIYFTVIATDNKQPQANTGRSSTLIVRWLEDEAAGVFAEGLVIDFIPEFFKSQRQIIIDTEQLIEDETHLQVQQFKDTSYEIGQSQADLKQKYGQYLGDEFGEGPHDQRGNQPGGSHESRESHDDAAGNGEHGDDGHEEAGFTSVNQNINSSADILRLYGHNHGDPEIGPITARSPVALMKRAVNEMWQAEKHLLQAEPGLALPFEYEAYNYLKLARQADRIYVKRLGFEPPPVTEERRLSGELDEILTYQAVENTDPYDATGERAQQLLLRQVYQLLSRSDAAAEITTVQRELLARMSTQLMRLSQQRPALVQQAATIEKFLLAGHFKLEGCEHCLRDLKQSIWNLMDTGDALLRHPKAVYSAEDGLIGAYQEELRQVESPRKKSGETASTGDSAEVRP